MARGVPVGFVSNVVYGLDGCSMRLWQTLKGRWAITFPYTVFIGRVRRWGFSYNRYSLFVSEDTTTPYSILHLGPFEFFVRPKSIIF